MGDTCFQKFAVSGSIEEDLGGDVFNLVLHNGWIAIGMFVSSMLCLCVYRLWVANRIADLMRSSNGTYMIDTLLPELTNLFTRVDVDQNEWLDTYELMRLWRDN